MKRTGFTLIEVILSLAIVGIVAVSTLTILNSSLLNIKNAGNRTTAVEQTEQIIINRTEQVNIPVEAKLVTTDILGDTVTITSSTFETSKITGTVPITGLKDKSIELVIYEGQK